jgi:PelA/Pel-15E family pectate lyase
MKKVLLIIFLLGGFLTAVKAQKASDMKWSDICSGKMGADWYGSEEAQKIADIVLSVQKNNGGWMKNDQLHKLTDSELKSLQNARGEHSCLDNTATTQEMRFLAKVWQKTQTEKYKESFTKALNMIFKAEKKCGGWSQYWPLQGGGSYWDYITFNDDLMTNVMRLLQEIAAGKGDFANIADDAAKQHCKDAVARAIDVIIKCQVDDNGMKAAWCAQHDTIKFQPAVGRPHELPSISGSESASLLSYLMTIENPSEALQQAIHSAVAWLDAHKIDGKAVEDFTNANGEKDRRVIDKAGSAVWGRFIQLGGETGRKTYESFFNMLKSRGKSRSYTTGGKTYTYTEYEIASNSYDPEKEYQPIFAIYDDQLQHLYYRFLYTYEDAENATDWKGCSVPTSLNALRRVNYQFMGSWPLNVIKNEYPAWKKRIESQNASQGYKTYALSGETNTSSSSSEYAFANGIKVTNGNSKGYANGKSSTVKYSANVNYAVQLPTGMKIDKVDFYGYDNYDVDAYISHFNGTDFSATDYVFPAKDGDNMTYVTHTLQAATPIENSFSFKLGSKQCCLIITLYEKDGSTAITLPLASNSGMPAYNLQGMRVNGNAKGLYIQNGKLFIKK